MTRRPINGSYNAKRTKKPFYINLDFLNRSPIEKLIAYSIVYNMAYTIKNGKIIHYIMY